MENQSTKRPGRPTSKKKDTVIRMRIDSDMHARVFAYAKENNVTVSRLIRDLLNKELERDERRKKLL